MSTPSIKYDIRFKPGASKEIAALPFRYQARVLARIEDLSDNLKGDVKQLTDFTPEYRLRVGDYRVLFEVEEKTIIVYRVRHRREVYR
jgi:mRNA interferase RelE/StbE